MNCWNRNGIEYDGWPIFQTHKAETSHKVKPQARIFYSAPHSQLLELEMNSVIVETTYYLTLPVNNHSFLLFSSLSVVCLSESIIVFQFWDTSVHLLSDNNTIQNDLFINVSYMYNCTGGIRIQIWI